jgi:hypothetical protein
MGKLKVCLDVLCGFSTKLCFLVSSQDAHSWPQPSVLVEPPHHRPGQAAVDKYITSTGDESGDESSRFSLRITSYHVESYL